MSKKQNLKRIVRGPRTSTRAPVKAHAQKAHTQNLRTQKLLTTTERQGFEQSVLRALKKIGAVNSTVLVATSGGVDSMVLLETIKQWQRTLNLKLAVAYIHHGNDKPQKKYRDAAKARVEEYCQEHGIRFVTNERTPKDLKSENDFREYRWAQLSAMADRVAAETSVRKGAQDSNKNSHVLIATAHHAGDLIETQLLRLLRGTGAQGLKGFGERDQLEEREQITAPQKSTRPANDPAAPQKFIIRPLLTQSKEQIKAYAKTKKLKFTQDPTNAQTDALRNWLREKWLKPLSRRDKQKTTNLTKSLAGSLAELGKHQVKQEWPKSLFRNATLHTPTFRTLTKSQQEAALATFMRAQQMKNYTKNHVQEILKRLDTNAKELKFRLLGREWHITAQHISYGRLDIPSE